MSAGGSALAAQSASFWSYQKGRSGSDPSPIPCRKLTCDRRDTEDSWQGEMMTDSTTILETNRLLFRRLTLNDVDALFELYRDPEVRRYFPEGTRTYAETKAGLEHFLQGYREHPELGFWATIYKETEAFIGRCGINPQTIEGQPELEVGYLIGKAYWRQGLGGEAAQAIADYGFEQLGLTRLICTIDRDNQASIKIATKIGMTFEREAVDEYGPFLLYSRSR